MPTPSKGEHESEFIPRCISILINEGTDKEQAAAICYSKWNEFQFESYSDYPDSVKNNAKAVLDWVSKNGWGSCGTEVGKIRANQLAKGESISVDTIQRMYSYLSRHEVDLNSSKTYSDGCGKLMYDSWGGLSAKSWSHNKLKELGLIEMVDESFADDNKVSFDYDDTLTTDKGKELAKRMIEEGKIVYIISARHFVANMLSTAKELGIPLRRVFATGSNQAKIKKVLSLNIGTHYDNNSDVVNQLKGIGKLI